MTVVDFVVISIRIVDFGKETNFFIVVVESVAIFIVKDARIAVLCAGDVGGNPRSENVGFVFKHAPLVSSVVVGVDETEFISALIFGQTDCVNNHDVVVLPKVDGASLAQSIDQVGFVRTAHLEVQVGLGNVQGIAQCFVCVIPRTASTVIVGESMEDHVGRIALDMHLDFVLGNVAAVVVVQHGGTDNPAPPAFFFVNFLFSLVDELELVEFVVVGGEVMRSAALHFVERVAPLKVHKVGVLTGGERIYVEVVDVLVRVHAGSDGNLGQLILVGEEGFERSLKVALLGSLNGPSVDARLQEHGGASQDAEKRDDEALRLLRIAQKYFPDDVTVQADIMEFEKN